MVLAACGGGGGDSPATTSEGDIASTAGVSTGSETAAVDAWEMADAVVSVHGPNGGLAAVLYALDRGYTAEQVVAAALAGSLGADGVVDGVDPALPPYGLMALPDDDGTAWGAVLASHRSLAADDGGYTMRHVRKRFAESRHREALGYAAALLGMGFSPAVGEAAREEIDWHPPDPLPPEKLFEQPPESAGDDEEGAPELTGDGGRVIIGLVLGLVDVGYPFDDALASILTGDWDIRGRWTPPLFCVVLVDAAGRAVVPRGKPSEVVGYNKDFSCNAGITKGLLDEPGLLDEDELATASEAEQPPQAETESPPAGGDDAPEGTYLGTLSTPEGYPSFVTDSVVEIVVTEASTIMTIDMTFDAPVRSHDDNVVCTLTIHRVWGGEGGTGPTVDVTLMEVSREVLGTKGPECGVGPNWDTTAEADFFAEPTEPTPITLTARDGTITSSIQGILTVTATKQ